MSAKKNKCYPIYKFDIFIYLFIKRLKQSRNNLTRSHATVTCI